MTKSEMQKNAKLPWMGCVAGRAIAKEPDAAELWQVIQAIRRRRTAYLATMSAPSEHPRAANLGVLPEPVEVRPDDATIDTRTDAERARDADRAWSAVIDALYAINPMAIRLVMAMVILDDPTVTGPLPETLRRLGHALKIS